MSIQKHFVDYASMKIVHSIEDNSMKFRYIDTQFSISFPSSSQQSNWLRHFFSTTFKIHTHTRIRVHGDFSNVHPFYCAITRELFNASSYGWSQKKRDRLDNTRACSYILVRFVWSDQNSNRKRRFLSAFLWKCRLFEFHRKTKHDTSIWMVSFNWKYVPGISIHLLQFPGTDCVWKWPLSWTLHFVSNLTRKLRWKLLVGLVSKLTILHTNLSLDMFTKLQYF